MRKYEHVSCIFPDRTSFLPEGVRARPPLGGQFRPWAPPPATLKDWELGRTGVAPWLITRPSFTDHFANYLAQSFDFRTAGGRLGSSTSRAFASGVHCRLSRLERPIIKGVAMGLWLTLTPEQFVAKREAYSYPAVAFNGYVDCWTEICFQSTGGRARRYGRSPGTSHAASR